MSENEANSLHTSEVNSEPGNVKKMNIYPVSESRIKWFVCVVLGRALGLLGGAHTAGFQLKAALCHIKLIIVQEKQILLGTELVASGHLEQKVASQRPLCVSFSCSWSTGRVSRVIMFMQMQISEPLAPSHSRHHVMKRQRAANGHSSITQPAKTAAKAVNLQGKIIQKKYQGGLPLTCNRLTLCTKQ